MKSKTKIYLSLFLALSLCLSISIAMAAEFKSAKEGRNIIVGIDERPRNLYTAGNTINVEGNVIKDMIAAGNIININGDIGDDLWLAGGTVVIRGDVGGSLRILAGNVFISGHVNEDVFIAGGNVVLSDSAYVGGDVGIAGGMINIEGPVAGNVYLAGGGAVIDSRINGNVKAKTNKFLDLDKDTFIMGDLVYHSSREVKLENGASVIGEIEFTEISLKDWKTKKPSKGFLGLFLGIKLLLKFLSLLALGLILVYFFNDVTEKMSLSGLNKFWSNLGIGFAALILIPIVSLLLLVTVIGFKLAVILGMIYALIIMLASGFGSVIVGTWMKKVLWKKKKYSIDWQSVLLGALAFSLLWLVPILGPLTIFIFILVAIGALYRIIYQGLVSVKRLK